MNRRRPLVPLLGVSLALALTACSGSTPADSVAAPPVVETTTGSATPTAVPSDSVMPSEAPSATPAVTPSATPTTSTPSYDVKAVQTRLAALKYYGGAVDGEPGGGTRGAVMAFQKVNGLGADGTVGPKTLAALKAPRSPALKGGPADRVEVDLSKQVLYVVSDGQVERIMAVSSGNGDHYTQKKSGTRATALTPAGVFTIQRRIVGLRKADLGTLYDPQYFYRGWAIHGSNSVPAYPASHGCVRVSRADAKYLLDAIHVGTTVYLYGGKHTFSAGSAAPGTDTPTGDDAAATPTATPSATPTTPTATPKSTPKDTPRATPAPTASSPAPTRKPSASPSATATPSAKPSSTP